MNVTSLNQNTLLPSSQEVKLANKSSKKLSAYVNATRSSVVEFKGTHGEKISIPAKAATLLMTILSQMAKGNAVALIPVEEELTTQEAADLLNVSRPYLVTLLKKRAIPFRLVGTKRRVRLKDILKYREDIEKKRLEVLEDLANEAQKYDMGY